MEDLKEVLDDEELHMFHLLLKDVEFQVCVDGKLWKTITTNIGAPQGNCASAIFFTFYLAKSLQASHDQTEHSYTKNKHSKETPPPHLADHTYSLPSPSVNIDQQYANDIGWATTNKGQRRSNKQYHSN